MAEKNISIGKTASAETRDFVAAHAELSAQHHFSDSDINNYGSKHADGDAAAKALDSEEFDGWESEVHGDRSEFAEAALDAFMQAWNDGDGDMTADEAFHVAADTMRDIMESTGMAMDNFETDMETGFEVFCNAMEDGEDPNDAFEIACQAIEDANSDNLGEPDGGNL